MALTTPSLFSKLTVYVSFEKNNTHNNNNKETRIYSRDLKFFAGINNYVSCNDGWSAGHT